MFLAKLHKNNCYKLQQSKCTIASRTKIGNALLTSSGKMCAFHSGAELGSICYTEDHIETQCQQQSFLWYRNCFGHQQRTGNFQ